MSVPRIPPLLLTGVAAVAQSVCARRSAPTPLSLTGAAALAVGSVWMLGGSAARFRREGTTVNPVDVDRVTALVETGPYRRSRNPMYVGMAGLLLAHAVGRRSWTAGVPLALYIAVVDRCQIPVEEKALRAAFGTDYDHYARRVPRWLDRRSVRGQGR
ncbi:isoprenylcysteine carboxylmethyltransferase family protein [Aeromicrobium sp. YIM 150415]|uniref:methyltransferase family protein n=1 Tax=Aeromicrobium sp. YIM 150415 TaxID=2803912 RepID=UPI001966C832|nr:isoprenylcysteine carboxylmethyltransferase family protein [Aeromicrobium sp. YIM 150415]MBM9465646.1 isoprenylcysteine carboxylmethyltransferase family protein [Aeromicrobium sp. YIM 150415]